jgi:hypothetical protein
MIRPNTMQVSVLIEFVNLVSTQCHHILYLAGSGINAPSSKKVCLQH